MNVIGNLIPRVFDWIWGYVERPFCQAKVQPDENLTQTSTSSRSLGSLEGCLPRLKRSR
jgi:hypothetical protein